MTTAATKIKKLLGLKFFDGYLGLIEPIEKLIKERDDASNTALALNTELNELMCDELLDRLGLENGYTPEQFHASMKVLFNYLSTLQRHVEVLRRERDELRDSLGDVENLLSNNGLLHEDLLTSVHKLLSRPDTTQPQLNEIRYVIHGDIQPCTVLYSDDTTTLLRLDEGDIMCETDTIEWSDSVTYRCQELLKDVKGTTLDVLAQLVRDERILLNDDADLGADEAYFRDEVKPSPMVVPSAPAVVAQPSCGNPYVHDSVEYPEAAMRVAGWQTEDLVQNGYGHYKPVSLAPWEAPSNPEDTWACVKCTHRFPSVYDRCPKCNTPKER